jgi:hypothetical protein
MSKVIYEFNLSYDGKRSVSVKSDDPLALQEALPLAKQLQARLSEVDRPTPLTPPIGQPTTLEPDLSQPQAPLCGVHSMPMTQVQGRRGPFWSCHQRNLDGSWCSYRPARTTAGPSPVAADQQLNMLFATAR